ncbi:PfaB family protein [Motilimonas eburnea]|uniref:PfaB family protein n=1 Tax=Motilimonas eburnea TaxID=1737488 RepID=UPI001E45B29B|nr:PfaB family protein [Motilimonas eburnea]MCE2570417.1 PfaB family protein [Motilimonas eburnea]
MIDSKISPFNQGAAQSGTALNVKTKWAVTGLQLVSHGLTRCDFDDTSKNANAMALDLMAEFVLHLRDLPARHTKAWRPRSDIKATAFITGQDALVTLCQRLLTKSLHTQTARSAAENCDNRASILLPVANSSLPTWLDKQNESNRAMALAIELTPMPQALANGLPILARLSQCLTNEAIDDKTDPAELLAIKAGHIDDLAAEVFYALQSLKQREQGATYWYAVAGKTRQVRLDLAPASYHSILFEQGSMAPTPWPLLASQTPNAPLSWQGFLPLLASSHDELIARLHAFAALDDAQQLAFCHRAYQEFQAQQQGFFSQNADSLCLGESSGASSSANSGVSACVAIVVAPERSEMAKEIAVLISRLNEWPQHDFAAITTPSGSVCRYLNVNQAQQLRPDRLCFVYPGVGTCYVGQFAQLHRYFPALYQALDQQGELAELLANDAFGTDGQGTDKLTTLAQAGVGSAWLVSHWLAKWQVKPKFAFGYSLGEVSMWAGLNVWQQPKVLGERLRQSSAFTSGITGELNGVAKLWQQTPINWASYSVRLPAKLTPWLNDNNIDSAKAWLAINHGDSGILQGDADTCQHWLQQSGCRAIKVNFVTAMHTPAARFYQDEIAAIFHLPLSEQGKAWAKTTDAPKLYSSGQMQPVSFDAGAISQSIRECFCQPLDFAALAQRVYDAGARVFIEVGAGRSCTTYLDKIYQGQGHLCLATNSKRQSSSRSVLGLLAQLLSIGCPVDLSGLLSGRAGPSPFLFSQSQDSVN